MGVKSAPRAAIVRLRTVSSVSPKYCRRSLWPMITWLQPAALIMGAETSPVKAPSLSQNTFCAPILMFVPRTVSTAAVRDGKGVQITISQWSASATRGLNASKYWTVSSTVLNIFQLPAMTGFRAKRSGSCRW